MDKPLLDYRSQVGKSLLGKISTQYRSFATILFVLLFATACATPSPRGNVSVASVPDVQQGRADAGTPLRWGGTIASVENKPDSTVLEIVSRPLLRTGRPRHNDTTDGRFRAVIQGFVDPQLTAVGRDISLVGTVANVEEGLIGEASYQFPVLTVSSYKLWDKRVRRPYYNSHPFFLTNRGFIHHRGRFGSRIGFGYHRREGFFHRGGRVHRDGRVHRGGRARLSARFRF